MTGGPAVDLFLRSANFSTNGTEVIAMALLHGLHPAECRCSSCSAADRILAGLAFGERRAPEAHSEPAATVDRIFGAGTVRTGRATEAKILECRVWHGNGGHAPEARPLVRR